MHRRLRGGSTGFAARNAGVLDAKQSNKLQCWGLGQSNYMLGANQGIRSFVVGFGVNSPTIVQHRASSCDDGTLCTWVSRGQGPGVMLSVPDTPTLGSRHAQDAGFFPSIPNPRLEEVQGALVWGPSTPGKDTYLGSSRRSDDTRIRLEDQVGFTGLLAGLQSHGVTQSVCFLGHGLYQRLFEADDSF